MQPGVLASIVLKVLLPELGVELWHRGAAHNSALFGATPQKIMKMAMSQGAVLIVDKPIGLQCRGASAKALDKLKSYFPAASAEAKPPAQQQQQKKRRSSQGHIKMGHAGTLDPMATGCLPVLLGQATKLQDHLPINTKRYSALLRLGVQTKTDDADGEVIQVDTSFVKLTPDAFASLEQRIQQRFPVGKIKQTPPIYSAIHIDGKRAYDLARLGQTPVMPEREIELFAFKVQFVDEQTVQLDVSCGTGTYIRTLGVDLAKDVFNTCGHLVKLRRVTSGPYTVPLERATTAGDEVQIAEIVEFRDAIASFAHLITVDSKDMLDWMKTGKNKQLYECVLQKLADKARPEKVAFENEFGVLALFKMEYDVENMLSICHFKTDEDLIPFVSKDTTFS